MDRQERNRNRNTYDRYGNTRYGGYGGMDRSYRDVREDGWDRERSRGMMGALGRRPWLAAGLALGAAYLTNRVVRGASQAAGGAQMMGTRRGTYLAWLNDAHATEKALVRVLEKHAKEARGHPEMQAKIEEHLEATKRHADLIKGCIERQGGHTSAMKSGLGQVMGAMQGMSTGPAKDTLVKNGIADYAAEHFEIASYRGLIAAAEELGDTETARICRQILDDEENMARWLAEHLPDTVREHLRMQPERAERAPGGVLPRSRRADHRYFEEHFQTHFAGMGQGFRDYEGAYRYGARLADEPSYRDRTWSDIEPEVRRMWEREHSEPWDSRKEAVHYGYNRGSMHQGEGRVIET